MPVQTAREAPTTATAGDTLRWRQPSPTYPAQAGTTAVLRVTDATRTFEEPAEAAPDGGDFILTLPSALSATLAGLCQWALVATVDGEQVTVARGAFTVTPLPAPGQGAATLSANRRALAAARATYEKLLADGLESYGTGDRTGRRRGLAELRAEIAALTAAVRREETGAAGRVIGLTMGRVRGGFAGEVRP